MTTNFFSTIPHLFAPQFNESHTKQNVSMARTKEKELKSRAEIKAKLGKKTAKGGATPKGKIAKKVPRKTKEVVPVKKAFRHRPGFKAMKEIRREQNRTDFAIPRAPYKRLAREIAHEVASSAAFPNGVRISQTAFGALQTGAEHFIIDLMDDVKLNMVHAGRKMIMRKDLFRTLSAYKRFANASAMYDLKDTEDPNRKFVEGEILRRVERVKVIDAKRKSKKGTPKKRAAQTPSDEAAPPAEDNAAAAEQDATELP